VALEDQIVLMVLLQMIHVTGGFAVVEGRLDETVL